MENTASIETGKPSFKEPRERSCWFCRSDKESVDYKDMGALRPFISDSGKIVARRVSGNCAGHQRQVSRAIKRARNIAVIVLSEAS